MFFKILKKGKKSKARLGLIKTPHGQIATPAFLPVATQATIKSLTPADLKKIGFPALLCNTYHLYLRPGHKIIQKLGGLHQFMNWSGPLITDSGGFQVFSLGFGLEHGVGKIAGIFPENFKKPPKPVKLKLVKIDEQGVEFRSHLDGSKHRLTPQKSIQIQEALGADIILAFDECTSPLATKQYTQRAMERTHRWAEICLQTKKRKDQALFGIIQGGQWPDLRKKSAQFIGQLPFDGLAIGGSLGKTKKDMFRILDWVIPEMPEQKPRHLLGIGQPEDLNKAIKKGIDLFDCVYPTRLARHGIFLTSKGELNILNSSYRTDKKPIMRSCSCYTCQNFSRAYLHHLFKAREMLGPCLATFHNLWFIYQLMKKIRKDIRDDKL
ncbi:MAG: tRNA guanosine(34) transglycosylase Tgt [Candidatus Portnoybacteria bacterium]|nr:tRNA guanosine(34) transglycosylase Tgt [Candidatus Portnoybacteria bacterium]